MAPDITPKHLVAYRNLAATADRKIRDVMLQLCSMVEHFRKTPESQLKGRPVQFMNASGKIAVAVPLEQDEITRIFDFVPDEDEIKMYGQRFDTLPAGDLRDAAFHLLWFANELVKDREPIIREKVFSAEELAAIDAAQIERIGIAPITLTAGR